MCQKRTRKKRIDTFQQEEHNKSSDHKSSCKESCKIRDFDAVVGVCSFVCFGVLNKMSVLCDVI